MLGTDMLQEFYKLAWNKEPSMQVQQAVSP